MSLWERIDPPKVKNKRTEFAAVAQLGEIGRNLILSGALPVSFTDGSPRVFLKRIFMFIFIFFIYYYLSY